MYKSFEDLIIQKINGLEETNHILTKELDDRDARISQLEKSLRQYDIIAGERHKELYDLQMENKHLKDESARLMETCNLLNNTVSSMEIRMAETDRQLIAANRKLEELKAYKPKHAKKGTKGE